MRISTGGLALAIAVAGAVSLVCLAATSLGVLGLPLALRVLLVASGVLGLLVLGLLGPVSVRLLRRP